MNRVIGLNEKDISALASTLYNAKDVRICPVGKGQPNITAGKMQFKCPSVLETALGEVLMLLNMPQQRCRTWGDGIVYVVTMPTAATEAFSANSVSVVIKELVQRVMQLQPTVALQCSRSACTDGGREGATNHMLAEVSASCEATQAAEG